MISLLQYLSCIAVDFSSLERGSSFAKEVMLLFGIFCASLSSSTPYLSKICRLAAGSKARVFSMDIIANAISDSIGKKVGHHRSLDENMHKLKRKYEELNSRREDVDSKMKVELRPGKRLKKEVELWFVNVQRFKDKKQSIENEVGEGKYFKRASLGELVAEMIEEAEELHQKGSFSDGLVLDAPPRKGEIFPPTKLVGETTLKKMEEIWDFLMNEEIGLIGVYGMGGVGKTTVMQQINNRLLEAINKFDNVVWITLPKVLNVIKLQDCIAKAFNVDLLGREDETTRAMKLFADLSEKKRYVLILDDVWEVFELKNVGIPEPSSANGCKVILTTRSLDVCRNMKCKDIKMELLSKNEAWNLFLDIVGRNVLLTPSLEATMRLVAKECAHLPLAIITIAGSMKGVVDEYEWRNTLEELREATGGVDDMEKVLKQLKHSYFQLKDEKLQHCLLYCALYPDDFEIEREELIKYLIDEGIVEGKRSRQAEFNKGHSILNKLENACLLESCTNRNGEKCVKMHDLIRDMALQIMSHGCMVEAGLRLRDLPNEEHWTEGLERVSLMKNYITEIHSGASPRCCRLSTLLLSRNRELRMIPNSFFVHMIGLRVLDLSYTNIEILPNSISDLENLTALLLGWCESLKYVPSLAKLGSLKKLDLSYTGIEEVPRGLKMLVNLRCLNLNAYCLNTLSAGILPTLSRLQCLIVNWESETLKVKGEEVASLRMLETFAGQFDNLHEFNIYVKSFQGRGPSKYLLQVGSGDPLIYFDEGVGYFRKHVILRKCSISRGERDSLVLPNDIDFLMIEECHDVSSLCHVSSLNNTIDFLKSCRITSCDGIECVLSSSSSNCTPLQNLEVLKLYDLWNLRVLLRGEGAMQPSPCTFSCLKELRIERCPIIKKLFLPGLLPHLQNLEVIRVYKCEGMEEIIAAKAEEEGMGESSNHSVINNDDTIITTALPKLRRLHLRNLPELKRIIFSKGMLVCDSLQEIRVSRCRKLKRLPFALPMLNGQLYPPPALKLINVHDRRWWESLEWDDPCAKDVLQPFVGIR